MPKVPYDKPALSYADILKLLKDRGLTIEDEVKAHHLLETIGYYRLSGYLYPLLVEKQSHLFKSGSAFETAFSLYKFDRELRLLVLCELEEIEVAIRAKMIHILSHKRGLSWYVNRANFEDSGKHEKTLLKINSAYQRSDEQFIKAFKRKYEDLLPPSWMVMEICSLGILSHLYSNLVRGKDKRDIAHYFGVDDSTFTTWLHSMVYLRNVCAHHNRLWNRVMRIQPRMPHKTKNQWLNNRSISNDRIYFSLSILIYLMNTIDPKHRIPNKYKTLLAKYENIDTHAMGFPIEWQGEPLWKSD